MSFGLQWLDGCWCHLLKQEELRRNKFWKRNQELSFCCCLSICFAIISLKYVLDIQVESKWRYQKGDSRAQRYGQAWRCMFCWNLHRVGIMSLGSKWASVGRVSKDREENWPKFQVLGQPSIERWIEKEKKVRELKRSHHWESGVREATGYKHFKVGRLSSFKCSQEASKWRQRHQM